MGGQLFNKLVLQIISAGSVYQIVNASVAVFMRECHCGSDYARVVIKQHYRIGLSQVQNRAVHLVCGHASATF